MRWATTGFTLLLVGMVTFMCIYYVLEGTMINEEEYHGLKEAMEGAMYDSIDIDYFHKSGEIKIIKEKFVETFTRRLAETKSYGEKGYTVEFYDIIESPPKASVIIRGKTGDFQLSLDSNDISNYNIVNKLDAVLLYNAKHLYTYDLYYFKNKDSSVSISEESLKMPQKLSEKYKNNQCKIKNMEYIETDEINASALNTYRSKYNEWYNTTATSIDNNICKIKYIKKVEYKDKILKIEPEYLNEDSCGVGVKYRVTWQCEY